MTISAAPSAPPDAVAALVAVTSCAATLDAPAAALGPLTEAAVGALGGSAGGVWVEHELHGGRRRVVGVGLRPDDDEGGLSEAVLGRLAGAPETPLTREELPEPLRIIEALHALALAVPVASGVVGALVVGGSAPLAQEPLRRHAARVAAQRIGRLLDGIRLRENLERAMAQILETDERMLGRIGLDIHDGPTQQLSVALLEVQLLEAELADAEARGIEVPSGMRAGLERLYETLGGALHEMRELIGHLRPAQFDDRRLSDILRDAITGFEQRSDCAVSARFEGAFPPNGVSITQRITFYRILQETLTNAHRHGAARQVDVLVREGPSGVTLEVRDDGRGFDPAGQPRPSPGVPLARFGLHGMRDRAHVLGGSFHVWSAPRQGAHVRVFLPAWHAAGEEATSHP